LVLRELGRGAEATALFEALADDKPGDADAEKYVEWARTRLSETPVQP
jgi:hypothetical protein